MNDEDVSRDVSEGANFYTDARRYDLVYGATASGPALDFYRRQIARYGEPVLELACGSGRFTIPLAEGGVSVTGLDLSGQMLELAAAKAAARGLRLPLVRGDARDFTLHQKFRLVFIPANSFQHLLTREDVEACLASVRRHLSPGGRFVIDIFNPSLKLLLRDPQERYPVDGGGRKDPEGGGRVVVTASVRYDAATQINRVRYFYRREATGEETVLSFDMRQFFPQEIEALLSYNDFVIEHKYGDFTESPFTADSDKQLIVCRPRESSAGE